MQLINFDISIFLKDYWQKKPLMIRNPWAYWRNPIEPDELAGLACDDEVESRLVVQNGGAWTLEHGPFGEKRFNTLGESGWTLLVQGVDTHSPDVAALLASFRFIPNWRVDDVMVSYAVDGGGVGPHDDQYDVFLIQGLGSRRWDIGAAPNQAADPSLRLLPHDDLRLLADFEPVESWVLNMGDILYLPPHVAHNGVALGADCMTYSIGFRAPRQSELIAHYCDHLLDGAEGDDRYRDPALVRQANPGEISASAIDRLHEMITAKILDRDAFAQWFGTYNSTRKYAELNWLPDTPYDLEKACLLIKAGARLRRNQASRFSFIRCSATEMLLFADGVCFNCAGEAIPFAEQLCAQDVLEIAPLAAPSDDVASLVAKLFNQGSIFLDAAI